MSEQKVYPLWRKSGIIPSPRMQGDHVHSGLLLSVFARIAAKHKKDENFQDEVTDFLVRTIQDEIEVFFISEEKALKIKIHAFSNKHRFEYAIYVPNSWFRKE